MGYLGLGKSSAPTLIQRLKYEKESMFIRVIEKLVAVLEIEKLELYSLVFIIFINGLFVYGWGLG